VTPATLNSVERITFNDPSGHIRMLETFSVCAGAAIR
jgi:hypothetical protein